ncbi:formin-like protein [Pseudoscourfieldia marina]
MKKKAKQVEIKKKEVVHLIDSKRSHNLSIQLASIKKLSHEDIASALRSMDDSELSVEALETLKEAVPTREEIKLVEGYKGDRELLGTVEKFFLVIKDVPRLARRVNALIFRATFEERVAAVRATLNVVDSAAGSVMASKDFKLLLQMVLASGNHLNAGTFRGGASGFHLETLLQLRDVKSGIDKKVSLLHFVVRQVMKKSPTAALLSSELAATRKVLNVNFHTVSGQIDILSNGIASVESEIVNTMAGSDDSSANVPSSPTAELDRFRDVMVPFCDSAREQMEKLKRAKDSTKAGLRELALYIGDPEAEASAASPKAKGKASTPFSSSSKVEDPASLLKIVGNFLASYDVVIKDVQKEEKEKEKAEKVAKRRPRSASVAVGLADHASAALVGRAGGTVTEPKNVSEGGNSTVAAAAPEEEKPKTLGGVPLTLDARDMMLAAIRKRAGSVASPLPDRASAALVAVAEDAATETPEDNKGVASAAPEEAKEEEPKTLGGVPLNMDARDLMMTAIRKRAGSVASPLSDRASAALVAVAEDAATETPEDNKGVASTAPEEAKEEEPKTLGGVPLNMDARDLMMTAIRKRAGSVASPLSDRASAALVAVPEDAATETPEDNKGVASAAPEEAKEEEPKTLGGVPLNMDARDLMLAAIRKRSGSVASPEKEEAS